MMLRRKTHHCLLILAVTATCLAASVGTGLSVAAVSPKESTARHPVEGSHEARTYRASHIDLNQYRTVFVENASMDTTSGRNEKVDSFLSQLQGTINTSMRQGLEASGRFETVTSRKEEAESKGKYLVCRSDALVHFGSTAMRFLIGFGAGRSKLIVVGSLEDPETGEVILKYTGWGGAVMGFGSQVLGKMQGDAIAIGSYFGNLARSFPQ